MNAAAARLVFAAILRYGHPVASVRVHGHCCRPLKGASLFLRISLPAHTRWANEWRRCAASVCGHLRYGHSAASVRVHGHCCRPLKGASLFYESLPAHTRWANECRRCAASVCGHPAVRAFSGFRQSRPVGVWSPGGSNTLRNFPKLTCHSDASGGISFVPGLLWV
jgi:hypothetical protein